MDMLTRKGSRSIDRNLHVNLLFEAELYAANRTTKVDPRGVNLMTPVSRRLAIISKMRAPSLPRTFPPLFPPFSWPTLHFPEGCNF